MHTFLGIITLAVFLLGSPLSTETYAHGSSIERDRFVLNSGRADFGAYYANHLAGRPDKSATIIWQHGGYNLGSSCRLNSDNKCPWVYLTGALFLDSLMVFQEGYLSIEFFDRNRNKIKVNYEYVEDFASSKEYYDKFREGRTNKGRGGGLRAAKTDNLGLGHLGGTMIVHKKKFALMSRDHRIHMIRVRTLHYDPANPTRKYPSPRFCAYHNGRSEVRAC
jgi:hypothetical protein